METAVIGAWLQFGAMGLLGFVLYYGMRVMMPQVLDTMKGVTAALEAQAKILARLSAIVLQHDATVRGHNPETLGTTEEIIERVLGK